MTEIKHIVYLMLENRSFDNLLGWLYEDSAPERNIPEQEVPDYDGLKEDLYSNPGPDGKSYPITKGTGHLMYVPQHDPHEEYSHVNAQLYGSETNPEAGQQAQMKGFYNDYLTYQDSPEQIMMTYTTEEVSVLNGLAKNFAVSDRYFSSVPSQTNGNRAFAASGNSLGLNKDNQLESWVNNRAAAVFGAGEPIGRQYNQKTLWNVLTDNGMDKPSDWMIYYSKAKGFWGWLENKHKVEGYCYTRAIMQQLQGAELDQHFAPMDDFLNAAKNDALPSVCFLEPLWGGGPTHTLSAQGSDYHPPTNLLPGEAFVKQIYDALTSNQALWNKTLFIINFDEHGGTYDHVAPPTNAKEPWADSRDGTPTPENFELGFKFDRFGVRVPLILVSPHVQASTVFRAQGDTPYDHTSVIATILNHMGVPKDKWQLGSRTANAPTFEGVFTGNPLRTDIPTVTVNKNGDNSLKIDIPQNDIQQAVTEHTDKAIQSLGQDATAVKQKALSLANKLKDSGISVDDDIDTLKSKVISQLGCTLDELWDKL